jgi:aspartyl-tRNA(Asn)/glutamyl-tRNA(Gln) amidotransferase subunit B
MRFDVNVSISPGDELGTRTETKNLNSFRAVEKAVDYEVNRQIELARKRPAHRPGNPRLGRRQAKTFSQRSKENADDYRYMPDPDLPPVVLDDKYVEKIKAEMSVMPEQWRQRLSSLGLSNADIETFLDAEADDQASYLEPLEQLLDKPKAAKAIANWFINVEIPLRKEGKGANIINRTTWLPTYKAIYDLVEANKLSSTNAKAIFSDVIDMEKQPNNIEKFAEEKGYIQVSDEGEIAKIVAQVISANPKAAEDVKNGEMKAIGFLVGQVMKASRGKANPQLAQDLIKKQLA